MGFFDSIKKAIGGGQAQPNAPADAAPAQAPRQAAPQPSSDMVMDPKEYFQAQNDVRARVSQQCGQPLAQLLGGQLMQDDDDLKIVGQYRGRQASLKIRVTFGTTNIEVATARPMLGAPTLHVRYDEKGAPAPGGLPAAPDSEQKLFLSQHVYIEGSAKELQAQKALLDRLPPAVRDAAVAALEAQGRNCSFMFVVNKVMWTLPASFLLHKQAPGKFAAQFDLLCALTEAIEGGVADPTKWTPATARLLSAQPTGTLVNMNLEVAAVLEVAGPQGPYHAQVTALVPQLQLAAFQPGATLQVRVNPANAQEVAVVF